MTVTQKKYWIVNKAGTTAEIFIYGDIFQYERCVSASSFVKELKELEKTCTKINVRINSNGGSVYEGIAIFNAIRNSKCEIDIYIDGIAASMASVIAMAGKKVYMSKYARLMTHKPSGGAWGTAEELRAVADQIDDCESILSDMYVSKTGMSKKKVAEELLNGKNVYLSADKALKLGLIDGIYDGPEVEVPESMTDYEQVWGQYQAKLTTDHSFNDTINSIIILA